MPVTTINAPYNFVPLAEEVVTPEWGKYVSHDLPFRDGLSGEMDLTITTCSPIIVGGEQRIGTETEAGQVHFFKNKDGRYTIPGSSLRGVIRSIMEIATFSRMNQVDNKRYGLRDISGEYVKQAYADRVRNKVKYGFLQLNKDGQPEITPCSMVRLNHRHLEEWWNEPAPVFEKGQTVREKYTTWKNLCDEHSMGHDPHAFPFSENAGVLENIGTGTQMGFPVFTGQITAEDPKDEKFGKSRSRRPKYQDFVFYQPQAHNKIRVHDVDASAWSGFLFIHGDEEGGDKMPWSGYWKQKFWNKEQVPVFYIQSKDRLQIGLAYMPKLAGDYSIHDMIDHTNEQHLQQGEMDFASLVFGQTGDEPEDALKGRVYFEPAIIQGNEQAEKNPQTTILNGAKPSYFPNYLKQDVDDNNKLNTGRSYATYVKTASIGKPELRGWKRYPVRPDGEVKPQPLGEKQTTKVQTQLHHLPTGARFKGRLVFHNLKPEELGALLWSIEMEGQRHSVGMAKSFGYGQVTIKKHWQAEAIRPNDQTKNIETPEYYIEAFQHYMKNQVNRDWHKTPQIKALKAMTTIEDRKLFTGGLKHMVMSLRPNDNDFLNAKKAGLALAAYVNESEAESLSDCVWVSQTIDGIAEQNRIPRNKYDDILKGRILANAWEKLDAELKAEAYLEIKRLWTQKGWWDFTHTGSAKKAKKIYDSYDPTAITTSETLEPIAEPILPVQPKIGITVVNHDETITHYTTTAEAQQIKTISAATYQQMSLDHLWLLGTTDSSWSDFLMTIDDSAEEALETLMDAEEEGKVEQQYLDPFTISLSKRLDIPCDLLLITDQRQAPSLLQQHLSADDQTTHDAIFDFDTLSKTTT